MMRLGSEHGTCDWDTPLGLGIFVIGLGCTRSLKKVLCGARLDVSGVVKHGRRHNFGA